MCGACEGLTIELFLQVLRESFTGTSWAGMDAAAADNAAGGVSAYICKDVRCCCCMATGLLRLFRKLMMIMYE